MNGRPSRQTFALRQRPLALCLACALGIGTTSSVSAANSGSPNSANDFARPLAPRIRAPRITGPADLPAESPLREAWEQRLANPPPPRPAATIPVTNCNDSGAGSLRDAMSAAVDGDTIDMTALTCSTITLTTGGLGTGVSNLSIDGPGSKYLAIDANNASGALYHTGTGTLNISDVTIENGAKYNNSPRGGCIFSLGNVALNGVIVQDCSVTTHPGYTYPALGGGIYATGNVYLDNDSIVTGSDALSSDAGAYGGGIFAGGQVGLSYSVVSHNTAQSVGPSFGALGGGVYSGTSTVLTGASVEYNGAYGKYSSTFADGGGIYSKTALTSIYGNVSGNTVYSDGNLAVGGGAFVASGGGTIKYSTIADNESNHNIGGIVMVGSSGTLNIFNSTISGNKAANAVGGLYTGMATNVYNSTIAFNYEGSTGSYSYVSSAGLSAYNAPVALQSSILAGNYAQSAGKYIDLSGSSGTTVSGANNLVVGTLIAVPGDTILQTDPQLLPLAYNGGPTRTHALGPFSPALDAGNNTNGFNYDQRGDGFPRVVGANADIGAFEGVSPDVIFANGFD